ncbi:MAG: aminotransferase class IV [Armatimonadota bacterium]|nr:aminotransferase class IV [Armatimonadota bacterium]
MNGATTWTGYWNGRFLPDSEIRLSPSDRGFVLGDAVYEITRTYRHVPFHLDWHLDRLFAGLAYIELDPLLTRGEIEALTLEVLDRNRANLKPNDDVTLTQRITRGPNPPLFGGPPPGPPTVIITCRPIHFPLFAHLYDEGVELVVPSVRLPVKGGIDPRVKMHSRLPMALASVQVTRRGGHALPLMVDTEEYITETSHTNVFAMVGAELVTPPDDVALGGITRRVITDLAEQAGVRVIRRPLHLTEVKQASEALVTGTGSGPLPVRMVDGRPFDRVPGPVTATLTKAFSALVGVDIVAQARSHVAHLSRA